MTQIHDKAVGAALLGIGSLVFTYYSIWTLIIPFVDEDHPARVLFPPQWYAIALPVFLLIVGVTAIFGFLSFIMLKSAKKAAKKAT
ncbi:dolichol phosphate-mannose biosynthesis regulatory [Kickxella alabastrina]|uniref:Dolichol phosphate-mannose biosynthesis regulatory protein n=1 Tax=Kickxella alabastrina TaxID=61397 RepID=A0ACC1IPY8_9FUNG|nr:dolichol phosphate-mannose biosynthesis regulatory [Kickxella alabastrina]XP_051388398.1 dolichol phosphate-mannose biosynthesis regulatory [Kickxella alabastrina]XP_051392633.1 dolichol phosphate-mannose biosynthesis regulatory [Kickxella alabastrina]KAI7817889.1 dolichol phosphate-mannose biosynthesis regulatory [Kickxella alabastrina]KAI7818371.1 dolichol phosphate-mannose biosynthesis regulatory [Kickxella alabastrina]KAI7830796.1 dolichol phosphate-mannose biosynthesis regulatory [Kick